MKQAFFWSSWFTTLGTTGLLFLWSLPLSPFTHPGSTANEAAIIFFPVMGLRWLAIASTITLVVMAWGRQLNLATGSVIGLTILVLALHLVLGLINIGIMNVWLSVEPIKTRTTNTVYAGIYFGLPTFWILLTAGLMLRLAHFRN
ncbi:hypothetical protein I8748_16935 [Nostoc sp. CENA67]|uniref:Uncharacterized protein n=1 Tax=Amazonocrinis nigriterrae CENA67 TaxID=2794033 RepID=A0A8J7HUX7_9NOST|nr:hypothetical protein [Amazonocrinis nigriterrae]MBH8563855.1 hypothetical protein [Amazonocrinis nigriterrae CENA67]